MFLYRAAKAVVTPVTRILWPLRVRGTHHIPSHGPVILASNHRSNLDPLFIGVAVPRPVTFIAKQELFSEGTPPQRVFARTLRAIGQMSVDRRPGQGAHAAMEHSLDFLRDGSALGIFPEGTRSPDGQLYRGQTGLAWLALASGAPVVPVALAGTDRILPEGSRFPALRPVGVRFGPAVDLSPWAGEQGKARSRRAATDAIMAEIQRLSGQQQASRYASSAKAEQQNDPPGSRR
ncbi:1-acyl-sn-glycerol-3-phosphate acyltransferase [Haloactinospora alba]|uniref:1-acyl-sn-glycerol-3-phosphate acyltransferase n=1 Tax=Haloactinospora alba TaxID=405555 RepID=A0A543NI67_9ACTN|nr:lysophospholipid acyltransferase family protein [Haloactinospora alba]TQN31536.1 1-acyl-sn-glycerol-3-phosphate acyltransferase [Haloactinospora alba]